MSRTIRCLFLIAFLFVLCYTLGILSESITYAQPQISREIANKLQELSPEQRVAVEAELIKTGGVLTPETIKSIEERPEFKGITPADMTSGTGISGEKEAVVKEDALEETEEPAIKDKGPVSLFDRYRSVGPYQSISIDLRPFRSEERRVGKECRSRWSPYH